MTIHSNQTRARKKKNIKESTKKENVYKVSIDALRYFMIDFYFTSAEFSRGWYDRSSSMLFLVGTLFVKIVIIHVA